MNERRLGWSEHGDEDGGLTIRPAGSGDVASIRAIETRCFSDPWTADMFHAELSFPRSQGRVAELPDGRVAAYCFWRDLGEEIEIHNLATDPELHRKGVARALLGQVIESASRANKKRVLLEVRAGNAAARALYAAFGFREDTVRRAYYGDREDAVLMSLDLTR